MRVEFVISDRGFRFDLKEYDVTRDAIILIRFAWFWKGFIKVWAVDRMDNHGSCKFTTMKNGVRSGWEFQGPIRKIPID